MALVTLRRAESVTHAVMSLVMAAQDQQPAQYHQNRTHGESRGN
jgi:hypothetical protein